MRTKRVLPVDARTRPAIATSPMIGTISATNAGPPHSGAKCCRRDPKRCQDQHARAKTQALGMRLTSGSTMSKESTRTTLAATESGAAWHHSTVVSRVISVSTTLPTGGCSACVSCYAYAGRASEQAAITGNIE
jgi:hypothetical protein